MLAAVFSSLSAFEYVHLFILAGERLRLRFCFDASRPLVFRVFRVLEGLMRLCLTGFNEVRHVFLLVSLDEEVGDLCLLEVVDILRGA